MKRHVLVTMREHGLRRIIAGALRTAGHLVVEAFDEPDMRSELEHTTRPFDAVVRDARRYPDATLNDVVRMRNAGLEHPAIFFVSRVSEGYLSEARRLGVTLLPLPLKSSDLLAALESLPEAVAPEEAEVTPAPASAELRLPMRSEHAARASA